ncbi:transposase [Methylomonas methanica]|uniref:Transposase n=1 Tax=Methylomonas methanica TaxID=421 RepID=A0ABY2CFT3_METMH|nr:MULTISPECIES: transposase [Methylomonas]TCV73129.1 transposase [Methylomonas methanica]
MSQEKPNTDTAEFRASAVKLANESDKPISQVAQDLGINVNTLHTWIGKYSRPKKSNKAVRTDEHLYDELKRLKQEVAHLTEERDLLKKAAESSTCQRNTLVKCIPGVIYPSVCMDAGGRATQERLPRSTPGSNSIPGN